MTSFSGRHFDDRGVVPMFAARISPSERRCEQCRTPFPDRDRCCAPRSLGRAHRDTLQLASTGGLTVASPSFQARGSA